MLVPAKVLVEKSAEIKGFQAIPNFSDIDLHANNCSRGSADRVSIIVKKDTLPATLQPKVLSLPLAETPGTAGPSGVDCERA